MALAAAPCRNHPDREAIGICVRCRTRVCSECSTKVEGINYCVSCLAAVAAEREPRRPARSGSRVHLGASVVSACGLVAVCVLLVWGMLEALLPGAG